MAASKNNRKIRYAVVGLGHIAQVAVLPAFAHARSNSQLTALVSEDPQKLKSLGQAAAACARRERGVVKLNSSGEERPVEQDHYAA